MPANNSDPYRHGGPYDRGSADKFYKRKAAPHYFREQSYQSERIEEENMTPQQVKNYHLGYGNTTPYNWENDNADTVYLRGRTKD